MTLRELDQYVAELRMRGPAQKATRKRLVVAERARF
jgi:hypothetical protein